MKIWRKNDFIYIDYVGIVKETNEVFDTTIKEEIEKPVHSLLIKR